MVTFWVGDGVNGRNFPQPKVGSLQDDTFGDLLESNNASTKLNRTEDGSRLLLKLDAQSNDDDEGDDASPRLNMALYRKAKTFGQSPEERRKVAETLQRLDLLVKNKMNIPPADFEGKSEVDATRDRRLRNKEDTVAQQRDFVPKTVAFYQKTQRGRKSPGQFRDSDSNMVHTPEELGSHFEGDIVLTGQQAEELYETMAHGSDARVKRKFVAAGPRRWNANRPIDYSFDGSHQPKEQKIIELALQHWEDRKSVV